MPKTITEKDKQVEAIIRALPLRYPYADYKALCKIPDGALRYLAANQTLSDEQAEELGLDPMRLPEFYVARWMANKHIAKKLEQIGYSGYTSQVTVAEKMGIAKSLVSKYFTGKRPFGSVANLQALSYGVLAESAHMTMHGEEGKIRLPQIYSLIASEMLTMPDSRVEQLVALAKRKKARFFADCDVFEEYTLHRPLNKIISERLAEFAQESARPLTVMFKSSNSNRTPQAVKFSLYHFFTQTENEDYVAQMQTVQWFSFASGQALDYFICENYCAFCPVFYDTGTKLKQLTDQRILFFIGTCTTLPPEERKELLSQAMAQSVLNEKEGTKRKARQYGKATVLPYEEFGLWVDETKRDGLFNRKITKNDL